jgi:hypothetical protein
MTFAGTYGPWAVVAGASDGVGAAFAEGLAERRVKPSSTRFGAGPHHNSITKQITII